MGMTVRNRSWLTGVAIGLAVTALGAVALSAGWMDGLGLYTLDLHFRFSGERPTDDRILLVDIDDASLGAISDWPWPRRRYAQIIRAISQAGAQSIVLDMVLADPSAPRVTHAGLGAQYDIDAALSLRGSRAADEVIYDDDELRTAMASAGNVYLAMFGRTARADENPDALLMRYLSWLRETPDMSLQELRRRTRRDDLGGDHSADDGTLVRAMLVSRLERTFGLKLDEAETQLVSAGVDRAAMTREWVASKKAAARLLASAFFAGAEVPSGGATEQAWLAFLARVLPEAAADAFTPDRTVLLEAFRRARSQRAIRGFSVSVEGEARLPQAYDETYPLDKFAAVARGVGFVAYEHDAGDGVVRSLPLLVHGSDRWYAQLGFAVACDVLGLDHARLLPGDGVLELSGGGQRLRIPINRAGRSVIAWHAPSARGDWRESFHHISARYVLQAALAWEAIEQNERRIGLAMGALLAARCGETPEAYARYEKLANERWRLRRRELRWWGGAESPLSSLVQEPSRQRLDEQIAAMENDALVWLERLHRLWRDTTPETGQERAQRDVIEKLHAELVEGKLVERLTALNRASSQQAATALAELREAVSGKIVLVGYTASSVADLVTTPVFSSMPGVMAHANVINMVLGGQFIRVVPWSVQILVLGVWGAVIAVVASQRAAIASFFVAVASSAVMMVVGVLLFRGAGVHLATLPIVFVIACVWTVVTVHRQFTEERVRRKVERALSQYTSPAIASRISQDANLRRLTPQPAQVTCFFSDLAGFTRLSERLGPGRTRDVLNPYLESMSAVLIQHGAIVNKFIGDGIFAFFNAPIRPCENHERSACAAAIACHEALAALNRHQPASDTLRMRIGIASGEVFVGDYGSDTKLDYTCIGDCVNLAARLEQANKMLGTSILVDGATAVAAGDLPTARALGLWRVSGRDQVVKLFEVCLTPPPVAMNRASQDSWDQMIGHFQARRWGACRDALESYAVENPDDSIAKAYLCVIAPFKDDPPGDDWDGAIDMPAR